MSTIYNFSSAITFTESVNVWPTFVAKCCCFGLKENKRVGENITPVFHINHIKHIKPLCLKN